MIERSILGYSMTDYVLFWGGDLSRVFELKFPQVLRDFFFGKSFTIF